MSGIAARVMTALAVAVSALAVQSGSALAAGGAQRAKAFAAAEVAYYADRVPESLRAGGTAAGTSVDTGCFSAADNRVDPQTNSSGEPTNPVWWQRDVLNQYCSTLRRLFQPGIPGSR